MISGITSSLRERLSWPDRAALLAFTTLALGATAGGDEQLVQDVEFLNQTVERYESARGWFSDSDDAARVLARLDYAGGDFGVPLMRGDAKVKLVPVTADEVPANDKWAYWNHARKRFVIWRGTAPPQAKVILRFKRTFRGTPRPAKGIQPAADTTPPEPAGSDTGPAAAEATEGTDGEVIMVATSSLPTRPVGPESLAEAWSGGSQATLPRLAPPRLSIGPDIWDVSDFPIKVSIDAVDEIPDGAAVLYSVNGSVWELAAGEEIEVWPGDELLAFTSAEESEGHADSEPVGGRYDISPIELELSLDTPAPILPNEALSVGAGREELFPTIAVKNFATLPPNLRDARAAFEVYWTVDGSDPAASDTAFPVLFADDAGRPQPLPMVVASLLPDAERLEIRAVARSKDVRVLAHSEEVSVTIEVTR